MTSLKWKDTWMVQQDKETEVLWASLNGSDLLQTSKPI